MVECFGSLGTRQFAIDGPHARTPGRGDQHLPVCRRRLAGNDAAGVAAGAAEGGLRAGLRPVRRASPRRRGSPPSRSRREPRPRRRHVLRARRRHRDRDARSRHDDGRRAGAPPARAAGRAPMRRQRCAARAASTIRTRVRTDSHLINWGRYGLGIYDTMTETTWHRRERAPSALFEFLGQLREGTSMNAHGSTIFDGDAISRADREFLASLGDAPARAESAGTGRRARRRLTSDRSIRTTRHRPQARLAFFADIVIGCWSTTPIGKAPS